MVLDFGMIKGTDGTEPVSQTASWTRIKDPDLVYQTNKWHRYLWASHKETSNEARDADGLGGDKLVKWPAWMREMFTRLYSEDPQPVDGVAPENQWAQRTHDMAAELPEFETLRDRCQGDQLWAGMSAAAIGTEVFAAMPEPPKNEDSQKLKQRVRGLEGLAKGGAEVQGDLEKARQELQAAQEAMDGFADALDASQIRNALRRGIQASQDQIDEAQDMFDSFGWGDEAGAAGHGGDIEAKRRLMQKVRDNRKLKKLAALAGRMRRIAAHKQRSKVDHVRDEIQSVTVGKDLARLLPSELVKLTRDATRSLFYKGYLESSLLCYDLKGTEEQGKGPIVVLVDNSGSMGGDRELWSKAIALALLDIAHRQNRTYALVHYDTKVQAKLVWERGTKAPSWDLVLDMMDFFSGGGTRFQPPFEAALGLLEQDAYSKADIIMITDGQADDGFAEEYERRAKAKDATTYGILIAANNAGSLDSFCDSVTTVNDLTIDNDATSAIFAI